MENQMSKLSSVSLYLGLQLSLFIIFELSHGMTKGTLILDSNGHNEWFAPRVSFHRNGVRP